MQIDNQRVVSFHYTLRNADGEILDSSREGEPLAYLHGAGNVVPGLEKAMAGHSVGDTLDVTVEPDEGYGAHRDELLQTVSRAAFQGVADISPGMQFQSSGPHGTTLVTVVAVNDDEVTVDANHPLAGQTLHFDVEVTDVREATGEERAHGHVHAPGAPHH